MTTVVRAPDPSRCPDCRNPLDDRTACGSCGLALQGPAAARLWEVDTALLRLGDEQDALLAERRGLLSRLRTGGVAEGPPPAVVPAQRQPAAEWTPQRVQNTLLSLGGLLLAVAALVFTAVTYDRLGAGGRAAVLVALTVLAATAVPRLLGRGLSATAETLTAVALVLSALDAYGLRRLGVADDTGPLVYAAVSAGVLAAVAAAYAQVVPVRLAGAAAVALAQLPLPLLLADAGASAATTSLCLAGQVAADLAVLALLRPSARGHVVATLAVAAALGSAGGLLVTGLDPADGPGARAVALLAHAAALVGAGLVAPDLRRLLWAAPVLLLAKAAHDLAAPELTAVQQPLVLGAVALLAVQAAALLPAAQRTGPVLGGLVVAAAGVVAVAQSALSGVLLPLTWALDPWTLRASAARDAVGTGAPWDGSVVTTVVLAAAAVTVGVAGLALDRLRPALVPAAVLVAATAVLLPLGLATSYAAALAVLLAVGAALLGAALLVRTLAVPLAATGTAVVLLAAAWSLADREATLAVLATAALLLAGLAAAAAARLRPVAAGLAGALAAGELVAAGAARDLAIDQVGGLLLVAVAALLGGAALLDRARGAALEVVALGAGVVAAGLAVEDPGWLSWVLAGTGLLALATALRPARRRVAGAGALLLAAASWVRLLDAEVTAPEPYVVPLGLAALALGHLRRRAEPGTRSWAAYGPGLTLLLVPSLLACVDDATLTRSLLLGAVALSVTLVGARERLQAPLALGGAVLALDALQLVGPVAAALPRWSTIGLAGTLLLVVGATYEQRRRELGRLRAAYDGLR